MAVNPGRALLFPGLCLRDPHPEIIDKGLSSVKSLPYKVITIASGVTKLDIGIFILASVISRGLRFYIVAALLWRFGEPIREFLERHMGKLALLLFVLLIAAFLLVKVLL